MKKIPETDGERELWYFDYVLYQVIRENRKDMIDVWMRGILENFHAIVHKPIRSRLLRDVERYDSARWLFNYYFNNKIYSNLSPGEKEQQEKELIEDSITLLKQANVKYSMESGVFQLAPIRYSSSVLTASFERLKNSDFSCNQQNIQYYIDAKKALTHIASQYQQAQKQLDNAQLQEMMQIAYSARDTNVTLREALLDKCKLDIQALEQR